MERIILDCDPGHDDALAMILAQGSPEIELLAVTTVAGNQTLPKVTENARVVAAVAGITAPICAGATTPLVRDQIVAADIHGESGLDGPKRPDVLPALDPRHAVDAIIDIVMGNEPHTVTLVPVGPLTNIALAMRKEPRIVERVKGVVLMGGGYHITGNTTPAAEFNIYADPEAAAAVFKGTWDVTMVGLDLTHQAGAEQQYYDRIKAQGTEQSQFVCDILDFFGRAYREAQHIGAPPVHDACCVAALIDPSVMDARDAYVAVETKGELTYGMTVTDFRGITGERRHHVPTHLDKDRFWDLMIDAIAAVAK